MDDKVKQFLEELSMLTNKHGLVIDGCECCLCPWLETTDKKGNYTIEKYESSGKPAQYTNLKFNEGK